MAAPLRHAPSRDRARPGRAGFPRDRLAGVARMVTISITAEALLFAEA